MFVITFCRRTAQGWMLREVRMRRRSSVVLEGPRSCSDSNQRTRVHCSSALKPGDVTMTLTCDQLKKHINSGSKLLLIAMSLLPIKNVAVF
ncbi:hypothetical protein J6590_061836 [Homalodisca vitripennis]|nr:hypothetical protein J6590_061836 [Homalodisca vitripennis]